MGGWVGGLACCCVGYRAILGEVGDVHVDARRYCLSSCDFSYCRSSSPCLISIISVPGPAGFAGVLLVSFMIIGNVKNKCCFLSLYFRV